MRWCNSAMQTTPPRRNAAQSIRIVQCNDCLVEKKLKRSNSMTSHRNITSNAIKLKKDGAALTGNGFLLFSFLLFRTFL